MHIISCNPTCTTLMQEYDISLEYYTSFAMQIFFHGSSLVDKSIGEYTSLPTSVPLFKFPIAVPYVMYSITSSLEGDLTSITRY